MTDYWQYYHCYYYYYYYYYHYHHFNHQHLLLLLLLLKMLGVSRKKILQVLERGFLEVNFSCRYVPRKIRTGNFPESGISPVEMSVCSMGVNFRGS